MPNQRYWKCVYIDSGVIDPKKVAFQIGLTSRTDGETRNFVHDTLYGSIRYGMTQYLLLPQLNDTNIIMMRIQVLDAVKGVEVKSEKEKLQGKKILDGVTETSMHLVSQDVWNEKLKEWNEGKLVAGQIVEMESKFQTDSIQFSFAPSNMDDAQPAENGSYTNFSSKNNLDHYNSESTFNSSNCNSTMKSQTSWNHESMQNNTENSNQLSDCGSVKDESYNTISDQQNMSNVRCFTVSSKIKFLDVSSSFDGSPFTFLISYYDPRCLDKPLMVVQSAPFKVYARRKRKRSEKDDKKSGRQGKQPNSDSEDLNFESEYSMSTQDATSNDAHTFWQLKRPRENYSDRNIDQQMDGMELFQKTFNTQICKEFQANFQKSPNIDPLSHYISEFDELMQLTNQMPVEDRKTAIKTILHSLIGIPSHRSEFLNDEDISKQNIQGNSMQPPSQPNFSDAVLNKFNTSHMFQDRPLTSFLNPLQSSHSHGLNRAPQGTPNPENQEISQSTSHVTHFDMNAEANSEKPQRQTFHQMNPFEQLSDPLDNYSTDNSFALHFPQTYPL